MTSTFLPPASKVCEGYAFTSVYLSTGEGCVWYPSMPCRSPGGGSVYPSMPCRFPGPHPRGSLWGLAGGVSRPTHMVGGLQAHTGGSPGRQPGGGSSGPHPGVSRPTPGGGGISQHALRQTPLRLTATAAGGTHLTGMHSCCELSCSLQAGPSVIFGIILE